MEQVVGAAGEAGEAQNRCAPRRSQNGLKGPGTGLGPDRSDAKEKANVSLSNLGVGTPPRSRSDSLNSLQFAAEDAFKERITTLKQTALRDAKREGIQLVVAPGTKTGFRGVHFKPSKSKPYQATACGGGRKNQHLGHFLTAEEAALCYARHIGKEAAAVAAEKQLSTPPEPITPAAKQAVATASAEGLELVRFPSANSGYKGVIYLPQRRKPYQVHTPPPPPPPPPQSRLSPPASRLAPPRGAPAPTRRLISPSPLPRFAGPCQLRRRAERAPRLLRYGRGGGALLHAARAVRARHDAHHTTLPPTAAYCCSPPRPSESREPPPPPSPSPSPTPPPFPLPRVPV